MDSPGSFGGSRASLEVSRNELEDLEDQNMEGNKARTEN